MRTVDRILIRAPLERVFSLATDVERWPQILPHYRWVRFLERRGGRDGEGGGTPEGGVVEMAAWRPFGGGIVKYPTWWVSEMTVLPAAHEIRYRHVRGITQGMDVVWRLAAQQNGDGAHAEIVHEWTGPAWPVIGGLAADLVIGPVFIHGIASRTLAGLKRQAENR